MICNIKTTSLSAGMSHCSPHPARSSMTTQPPVINRRSFLHDAAGGGFALGGLLPLGFALRAAQAENRRFKFANTREVPSVCPYCAVGCGQLISVRDDKIVNIEGNPDSPINAGTLCPK